MADILRIKMGNMLKVSCDKVMLCFSHCHSAPDADNSKEILFSANVPSITAAEEIAEEAKNNCGIDGTAWLGEISRLHSAGVYSQEEKVEVQYFPTEEEYDRGGYEVYWSLLIYYKYFNRVFPFERDSTSKLIEFIIRNAPMTD